MFKNQVYYQDAISFKIVAPQPANEFSNQFA
jgi:hypothetical protein